MTLRFIALKHYFCLCINLRLYFFQPLGNILMYGRFRNIKLLCRGSYGCPRFNYIFTERNRSVLCRLSHPINS